MISNMVSPLISLPHSHSSFRTAARVNLLKGKLPSVNSLMKKNHDLLIDVEKALDKIQYLVMIKVLKLDTEWDFFQSDKQHLHKLSANMYQMVKD